MLQAVRGHGGQANKFRAVESAMQVERPGFQSSSTISETDDIPVRPRGGYRQFDVRKNTRNTTTTGPNHSQPEHVDVVANYVEIKPMKDRVFHKYRVDFEPKVESVSKMRYLFRTAARNIFERIPIYDGAHECRSGQLLPSKVTISTIAEPQDGRNYTVRLTNNGRSTYSVESIQTYNMHMKDFLKTLGFYSPQPGLMVHPNHYDQVGQDIMMMRGFRTSANIHDGKRILMNLESAHKLVQRSSVLTLMEMLRRQCRGAHLPSVLSAALVGKLVVTSYNKRCYRIEDIVFETRPTHTFDRNGVQTTFVDYYFDVYEKRIYDLNQPMLKAVPNNKRRREEESRVTFLVPELCNIAGLTDTQRTDNRLKMDLIRASQVSPANRVRMLKEFLHSLDSNKDVQDQLANWGYLYSNDLSSMKAKVLTMTRYAYGDSCNTSPSNYPKADVRSADINVNGLAVIPKIRKLYVITARNQLAQKSDLLAILRSGFDRIKLNAAFEHWDIPEGDSPNHYINAIRSLPQDTSMAIVIMQQQHKERYDAIKKVATCERGLITQVVTARLLSDPRKGRSAAQKIAIQVAAKVGGEPWWADIPIKKTMVCGYDTYHDTTKRGRSFGAFVASLNTQFSRWWSKADAHERLEEVSSQISANIIEALSTYRRFNQDELPERIIIYRDGVGEGQLGHVNAIELEKIKEALQRVAPKTRLTMIIVNKRIGARFYMRSGADGSFQNPPPGTVVDHTVTREDRYDFYLISQSTRQGTVTPTYYNIIHDESGFSPDIHQRMAFKLCLLYYNWSGTVRVPAPCQYAHKLALLCGEHLHTQPNATMDDKLHYL